MDESLFMLLLLSGLFWISSALSRQYRYISLNKSWLEAQSFCRGRFTDLATVDTMDDVNKLVSTMNAGYDGPVWIGLKRGTEKHWAWANGEDTLAQYSYWGPGEPGSEHDCVMFDDYWVTKNCSDLHYVLCGASSDGCVLGARRERAVAPLMRAHEYQVWLISGAALKADFAGQTVWYVRREAASERRKPRPTS